MANNRTEALAAVIAALVPTLTLAQLIALWNNELNDTYLFRKDVIASETSGGGAVTIDYSDKDTATVTTAVNLAVSFTNIENGDVKYLIITKALTNVISFVGATDASLYKGYVNNKLTLVPYEVFNKNGAIYVRSLTENVIIGTGSTTPIFDKDPYIIPTSAMVGEMVLPLYDMHVDVTIPAWDMDTDAILNISTPSPILANFDRIKGIVCVIYADGRNSFYDINYQPSGSALQGGSVTISTTNIVIERLSSGFFNSTLFNDAVQDRGYLRIFYSTS